MHLNFISQRLVADLDYIILLYRLYLYVVVHSMGCLGCMLFTQVDAEVTKRCLGCMLFTQVDAEVKS